jgi:hypothetical protein
MMKLATATAGWWPSPCRPSQGSGHAASSPSRAIELHCAMSANQRPLSESQIIQQQFIYELDSWKECSHVATLTNSRGNVRMRGLRHSGPTQEMYWNF